MLGAHSACWDRISMGLVRRWNNSEHWLEEVCRSYLMTIVGVLCYLNLRVFIFVRTSCFARNRLIFHPISLFYTLIVCRFHTPVSKYRSPIFVRLCMYMYIINSPICWILTLQKVKRALFRQMISSLSFSSGTGPFLCIRRRWSKFGCNFAKNPITNFLPIAKYIYKATPMNAEIHVQTLD